VRYLDFPFDVALCYDGDLFPEFFQVLLFLFVVFEGCPADALPAVHQLVDEPVLDPWRKFSLVLHVLQLVQSVVERVFVVDEGA